MLDDSKPDQAQLHDEMENTPSNPSTTEPFAEIAKRSMTRRGVMTGTLAGAATTFLAPEAVAWNGGWRSSHKGWNRDLVGFEPLTIADATANDQKFPSISPDYQYQVLIPWGTPIEPGITEEYDGDPNTRPTPEQACLQIGIGHDGMWYYPLRSWRGQQRGMLCINHEFGVNSHVLGKSDPESLKDVRLSQAVHGVSVVKIGENRYGEWEVKKSAKSRRITVNTPVAFSGPAAHSELLQNENGNIPLGTVNNCGSGPTPWGTYLTCEENFNGYFGYTDDHYEPTAAQSRYGFSQGGFGYGWYLFDKRFDISDPEYANECNRFGWIVEIDPMDASQKPVKRTALGRFKHEAIAIAESSSGRIAAYMGDDERFDYCYKFKSDRRWREAIRNGDSPLDEGTLFVAKFHEDGTGEWLPLTLDNPALSGHFSDMAELLVNTRIASDLVGATPMDRPEWTTIGKDGSVFWTLTNNTRREEVNAANTEAPNNDGHIIRTKDDDDYMGDTFTWEFFIIASSTRETEAVFTDPDAAYADPFGRLFIGTDGGQPDGLQDQLVVFDTTKDNPEPKRLLTGVVSDEITGWTTTPDYRTAFTNIQHPGNGNPEATNFPAATGSGKIPRDCTLVLTKKRGRGVIGS